MGSMSCCVPLFCIVKAEINIHYFAFTKTSAYIGASDIRTYVNGYLETDLRPECLWSRHIAAIASESGVERPAASSSSVVEAATPPPAYDPNQCSDTATVLLEFDLAAYAEALLAAPGSLFSAVPTARAFSKFRSIEHIPLIDTPPPSSNRQGAASSAAGEDV